MKHIILLILLTLGVWAQEVGVPFIPEAVPENTSNMITPKGTYISYLNYLEKKKLLIAGDSKGVVSFITLSPLQKIGEIKTHDMAMAVTPNEQYLITLGEDNDLKLWDIETKKLLGTFETHDVTVSRIAMTPDSKTLITTDSCSNISYWEIPTFKKTGALILDQECLEYTKSSKKNSYMLADMKLSHNGKYIAIANASPMGMVGNPTDLYIIDIAKNQIIASTWIGNENFFHGSIGFSNDDRFVLFSSRYGKTAQGKIDVMFSNEPRLTKYDFQKNNFITTEVPLLMYFTVATDERSLYSKNPGQPGFMESYSLNSTARKYSTLTPITSNIILRNNLMIMGFDDGIIKIYKGQFLDISIYLFDDGDWIGIKPNGYFSTSYDAHQTLVMKNVAGKPVQIDDTKYQKFNNKISIGE